jgi:AcrR family transcriptional regulator
MSDTDKLALPRSVRLLWGLEEPQRRGPKPGLDLATIAAAAIKLADAEGMGAVSMARVAHALGFTTMSLYRYVSGKDELVTLMLDVAIGKPELPADAAEGWRTLLERWSEGYLAILRCHPWMTRTPISGPPINPNNVAWMEYALGAMAETALFEQEKLSIMLMLTNYVRGVGQMSVDFAEAAMQVPAGQDSPTDQYGQVLSQLIDADRFPHLHAALSSGALDDEDEQGNEFPNQEFAFGLQRILDGVALLVEQRQRNVDQSPPVR